MNWRLTNWLPVVLAGTLLSGCAALDLLEGQLPGEEDEAEPLVDVAPYPPPQRIAVQREPAAAVPAQPSQPPAPVVTPPQESPATGTSAERPASSTSAAPLAESPTTASANTSTPAPAAIVAEKAKTTAETSVANKPAPQPAESTSASPALELNPAAQPPQPTKPEPTAEERTSALLQRRDELIAALEEEVKLKSGQEDANGELLRLQQQLRLLYLLAERPDDAVGEIESLPAAEQEAFKQLMFGLSTWLSADEYRRPTLRNARVLRSLQEASAELAAAAKLDVKNLRFCESVEGFGWYKEFPTAQFRPKQQVILYAEVDNFASQKQRTDTYETELAVSYQIFDGSGTIIDERELPLDKETCRNQRRDYFLAYRIYLPDGIAPGRYRLELTVEDLKAKEHYQGRKLGDGQIEFAIR